MAVFPELEGHLPDSAGLGRFARGMGRLLAGTPAAGHGLSAISRAGQGLEFLDYREYAGGDDIRHIDWRASARSGALQLRRFSDERASDWTICLDGSASMVFHGGAKWLLAAQLSEALSYLLLHLGHRVTLLQFSEGLDAICPPGRGHQQQARIVQALLSRSGTRAGAASSLASCAPAVGRSGPLVLISDFLQPDAMRSEIDVLWHPRRKIHALQILSPDETRLPETVMPTLQDCESSQRRQLASSGRAATAAEQSLQALQEGLRSYCENRAIQLSQLNSGVDCIAALIRHFHGSPLH